MIFQNCCQLQQKNSLIKQTICLEHTNMALITIKKIIFQGCTTLICTHELKQLYETKYQGWS
jgi:hypothetical protein